MVIQTYVAAFAANILSFLTGSSLSWSSPILPKLNVTNKTSVEDIPFGRAITSEENSWIGSSLSLGAIFGSFIYGYLADKIGRKFTLISLGVPFMASYLILAFSQIVVLYYVARIISGVALGGVFTVIPMYVGEIAEDTNRGALGSVMGILITFGLLFSYSVGAYAPMVMYNISLAVIPGLFSVLFFFVAPESPHYLVAKGNLEAASQSLIKLRGSDKIDDELDAIKTRIEQSKRGSFMDLFKSKGLIKALTITLSLVAFQQLSGISAVLYYAQAIFDTAGGGIPGEVSSIIIGAVFFITSFVTPFLVDKLGRKMLLYFSGVGMTVSEISLGVYFYLQDNGDDVSSIFWLPIVSLVVYIITDNIGFAPLPWVVMGELFPSNVKSAASSLTSAFCWFLSFLVSRFFLQIVDGIGMGPTFWLFAGSCVVAFFFTMFVLIETKGKSLQEIQDILES